LYVYSQPESRENSGPAVPIAIGSNRGLYLKWSVFAKNAESENNIPVLCTSGYNAVSDSLLLIIYSSNADSPDSYRGEDAVRLPKKGPAADLTASARPVNVEKTTKGDLSVPIVPIAIGIGKAPDNVGRKEEKNDFQKYSNADRSRDAVRLPKKGPAADLTASARPVNVENAAKGDLSVPIVPIAIGIGEAPDNVGYKLKNLINEAGTIKRRSVLPHL
jgi:hypothetical protein